MYRDDLSRVHPMLDAAKEPGTKFEEVGTHFIVTFRRKGVPAPVVQKGGEKTVEKILELIKKTPKITQSDLVEKTGLTRRGIEWNIKKLKELKYIKRVGSDKTGYWQIIKEKE